MNIILCVVAATILVTVVKSGKSVEEETEEMKRMLEQFKLKAESIKQKVPDSSQLENNFKRAASDASKIIDILKDSLQVFEQQRIEKEKIEEEKRKELDKKTPKEKLEFIKKKLPEVINKLGAIESEVKSNSAILSNVGYAITYAGQLSEALDVALKVEEKAIDIEGLKKKADLMWSKTYNIGFYARYARNPAEAKKLQESVYKTVEDIRTTLASFEPKTLG
ncbi:hypothetical protein DdX_17372 [Ditylenchus destructor]|uniref:Uncharacterized protein n=1 Tax=Ditylenchus destructor TaxID=166010 RepID=A0AAD4MMG9_9BILA|nr:hypothetical protein DdX_17372 [Ditylenchus destructor]